MNKILLLLAISFIFHCKSYSQDKIFFTDGSMTNCKLLEITKDSFIYTRDGGVTIMKVTKSLVENYARPPKSNDIPIWTKPTIEKITIQSKDYKKLVYDSLKHLRTEEYCMILGYGRFFSHKLTITIDFGQEIKIWGKGIFIPKDENNKPIVFNSMIDAMNFMNLYGWLFVNAYVITEDLGILGKQNVYHWLLKRKLN